MSGQSWFWQILVDLCARAWQTKKSRPEARENFLVMKIDFPSLMRYGKSFKNITRTLKQLLLEIILFLWSFSKSHVPNEMSRFWWFSGHKIWTHGPIWLILVGNDSPLWDLSYKSVCNNIRQFPKLQEGHKHWFLKGTIIAAIDVMWSYAATALLLKENKKL